MGNDVSTPSSSADNEEGNKSGSMVSSLQNKLANFASTSFSHDLQAKTREYAEKLHLTKSKQPSTNT